MDDLVERAHVEALLADVEDLALEHVVVVVVVVVLPLPRVEVLLAFLNYEQLQVHGRVADLREEVLADVLVLLLQTLQNEQTGDLDEDLGLAAVQLLLEALVLLRGGLQDVGEVY